MAPILIRTGALGNYRDMRVLPQHRMLVADWRAEMYFAKAQVLVAAKHLVNGTTIRQAPSDRITYVHLAFDCHEVLFAEGCLTESPHLAAGSLSTLGPAALAELRANFPELTLDAQSS